jgi:hypothetical protein
MRDHPAQASKGRQVTMVWDNVIECLTATDCCRNMAPFLVCQKNSLKIKRSLDRPRQTSNRGGKSYRGMSAQGVTICANI